MHYKTAVLKQELEPVDRFLKEMGVKDVTSRPRLSVTKANLLASTQVLLMNY
jgi:hypothetical protein